ncbi:MAG: FHA domain-containing protein [Deltaproteobacteria bacterium]|nr:FHA domain-containing protein [Deltaproteobacteria bacterium]
MVCPGCNRNNAEGLDFCDYCGTPLGAAAAGKRKTEMEVGGGGGGAPAHGGAPKRRTEFEAPPPGPPAALPAGNPFGGGDDPFDPFKPPSIAPGQRPAMRPADAPAPPAAKRVTKFDSKDPFAPQPAAQPGHDERYLGRRIVGWMITFDNAPDGLTFTLREGRNLLGRDAERCDIVIGNDDMISGGHAVLVWRTGRARIADDKSQNGTFLNEEDVLQPEEVKDGDIIRIGRTRFICRLLDHDKVTKLWKPA